MTGLRLASLAIVAGLIGFTSVGSGVGLGIGSGLAQNAAPGGPAVNLPGTDGGGPIEIVADGALEWQRDAQAYVARGNAVAARGDLQVAADILIAYYRPDSTGSNQVYRLDARGNVRLRSADAVVEGAEAAYDVAQEVAVVTGEALVLRTETDQITAEDSLEFWQARKLAVARGNAEASRAENVLRSDNLIARFVEDEAGELAMRIVDATGGVVIQTPTELVRGTQGRFDVDSNLATLTGDVRLTRGSTQLNGDRAEVNMETGISRLFTLPGP
ncbi:MAG: LptA/OstA family protein, partial [Pseudomonadota bacterium]